MLLPIFIVLIPIFFAFDFETEYKKLVKNEKTCDTKCSFDQPEITMQTMIKWPSKCPEVCGIVVFNENFNVPVEKLRKMFAELYILYGGIRIENTTTLTDLSFFPDYFEVFCSIIGTSIANNSLLNNVNGIINMYQWDECYFRIADNPKLDVTSLCDSDYYRDRLGMQITGNMADCGCKGAKLTRKNSQIYRDCESIQGKLIISDIDGTIDLGLAKVQKITGDLEVKKTALKDLSMLRNLVEIKSKSHISNQRVIIDIHDNPEMIRLGWRSVKNLTNLEYGHFMINFQNLHPDFCLTMEEISLFLDFDVHFKNLQAQYCDDISWTIDKPKLCVFDKMDNLDVNCAYLFGDLLVDSGDEEFVGKLKYVRRVFGSVMVQNTQLKDGRFMRKLERVVNLNESIPVIRFSNNTLLENLEFPSLQNLLARGQNQVVFEGNGPDLFDKTSTCMRITFQGQTNVSYNGKTCKSVNKTRENSVIPYDDNYSEGADLDWYDEYEGRFYDVDRNDYQPFFMVLRQVNDVTAGIGFLINIFHLLVLFHRNLRTNFIYIMMIGISISDIVFCATFLLEFVLSHDLIYKMNNCQERPYWHVFVIWMDVPIRELCRRTASVIAVIMVLFRTGSVMFPMNNTIVRIGKWTSAVFMVFFLFLVNSVWDFVSYWRCEILESEEQLCDYNTYTGYYLQCVYDSEDGLSFSQLYLRFDGFFTVFIAILYLLTTICLLIQLRSARKRRKALGSDKSENTSMLVTVMGVTFFVAESFYAANFLVDQFLWADLEVFQYLAGQAQVITFFLLIINSSIHCLICFFMSAQYRTTVRQIFSSKDSSTKSVVPDMATVSIVKEDKGKGIIG